MSPEYSFIIGRWRRRAGEGVQRLQHGFRRYRSTGGLPAADVVPDLAVASTRLLEESDGRARNVSHVKIRPDAAQLCEHVTLEIHAPRIFRGQVDLDAYRFTNRRDRPFVSHRKRVGS